MRLEERVPERHREHCLARVKAGEKRAAKARNPARQAAAKQRAKRRKEPAHIQWRRALLARKREYAAPKQKRLDRYRTAVTKDITRCKRTFFPDPNKWSTYKRRRTDNEDVEQIAESCRAAEATAGNHFTFIREICVTPRTTLFSTA